MSEITSDGMEALNEQIAELEGPVRVALSRRIQAAREEGDLKENAEYHIAKEDQAHLETKILRLRQRRDEAVVVKVAVSTVVSFGVSLTVTNLKVGKQQTFTIVGPTEVNLGLGKISSESPVAKALLGTAAGSEVEVLTPTGNITWLVNKIGA